MNSSAAQPPQPKVPRIAIWIATGFGLGYLPIAPGTWGSLGGILLFVLCARFADAVLVCLISWPELDFPKQWSMTLTQAAWVTYGLIHLLCIVSVGLLGVWAARKATIHFRKPDPGPVVIDEISGQHITCLPLLMSGMGLGGWKYLLLGFILFRVFDIVKPPPARQAEKWPNGWGIMADDWFAGMYAALVLLAVKTLGWM